MTSSSTAPLRLNAQVLAHYRELRALHRQREESIRVRRTRVLQAIVATVLLIAWLTSRSLHSNASAWPLAAAFALFAGLTWGSLRLSGQLSRQQRLLGFYDRNLRRVDGSEPQSGRTGLEAGQNLRRTGHLYDRDLDLLGPDSLFGLLATARTGPGERGIARLLLEPASHQETLERQEAVRELLPNLALREEIALLGTTIFQQISASFFDEWLDETPPVFNPVFRYLLAVTAVIAVSLLAVGMLHVLPWATLFPNLAADLAVQGALCGMLRSRVLPLLQGGAKLEGNVKLFSEGLAVLQRGTFQSARLRELQRWSQEPAGAVKALARLRSQLAIVEQRPKEYFFLFSLLLAAGTQAAIAIAGWKRAHGEAMRGWLRAWSEFEALSAVANYAFEHPEDAWPELLPEAHLPIYRAEGLGHPLLEGSVRNDIRLGERESFYLISGSNMAGKSTLLRSIGINAVLAYAGAPVRASALTLTPLRLGASLALTDSLAEGKSKFKAEVERLAEIVRQSDGAATLFLVDEIFSGTNSLDRRTAAGAVLDGLLEHGAIGALSTHDLALTDLATETNGGTNVHMASPDPEDPLAFDYKLKPGVNTSSNAMAIIRMMGLKVQA